MDIPIIKEELEVGIEKHIRCGAKLSELFLIVNHKDEGEFKYRIPDETLESLKKNLKPDLELATFLDKDIHNHGIDLSPNVNQNFIRTFYLYWAPGCYVLDSRRFNYPKVSRTNSRAFKKVAGKASHILKP